MPGAPPITAGPVGRTINAVGTAVLDVVATGTVQTYRWQFNGVNFHGVTNASCVLANAGTH